MTARPGKSIILMSYNSCREGLPTSSDLTRNILAYVNTVVGDRSRILLDTISTEVSPELCSALPRYHAFVNIHNEQSAEAANCDDVYNDVEWDDSDVK